MAMMAMTTRSSIKVNADGEVCCVCLRDTFPLPRELLSAYERFKLVFIVKAFLSIFVLRCAASAGGMRSAR
jgi:hypothetical protein